MASQHMSKSVGHDKDTPQDVADVLLGIDTGGTFTDFVVVRDGRFEVHKVASTPNDPAQAIATGIAELGLAALLAQGRLRIVHGSTVATNAVLEGKLAPTLYITNRGFEDVLALARQARRELYDLRPSAEPTLAPAHLRVGTGGRITVDGTVLEPLTEADLDELDSFARASGATAAAINLLYSFVDPSAEMRIAARLQPLMFTARSSHVLPEYREYERGVATYLSAALGPRIAGYLHKLHDAIRPSRLAIMMSSGGTIAADQAAQRAVNLLLSGPAGGLVAAAELGAALGEPRLLTFDMGGTSTDVALIQWNPQGDDQPGNSSGDGNPAGDPQDNLQLTQDGRIAGWPIAIAMADIHTIGAGGGSIARVDEGGLLQVGPASAGAVPGAACYARGGIEATVTDANLVLGRLAADTFLGGAMRLDVAAAQRAVQSLADALGMSLTETALGIVRLANEHMIQALRVMSVERGHDPRAFTLCCFGGAGGLHVCALAEALGITAALLPPFGAVFSALGMLQARPARHLSRSLRIPLPDAGLRLAQAAAALEAAGRAELLADGWANEQLTASCSVDLRYRGQSYWLNVPWSRVGALPGSDMADSQLLSRMVGHEAKLSNEFHALHEARYGHRVNEAVELINVRIVVTAPRPQISLPRVPSPPRENRTRTANNSRAPQLIEREALSRLRAIDGPALITEPYTTTFVETGWQASVDALGCLHLRRTG